MDPLSESEFREINTKFETILQRQDGNDFMTSKNLLSRVTSNREIHGQCVDPIDRVLGGVLGCDGVFSTARDLAVFSQMLLNGGQLNGIRILPQSLVDEFLKDQTHFAKSDRDIHSPLDSLLRAKKGLGFELSGTPFCHGGCRNFFMD